MAALMPPDLQRRRPRYQACFRRSVNVSVSLMIASPAKRGASSDLWAAVSSPAPQASAMITGMKHRSAA